MDVDTSVRFDVGCDQIAADAAVEDYGLFVAYKEVPA